MLKPANKGKMWWTVVWRSIGWPTFAASLFLAVGASFSEVFNATGKDIFSDFGQFQVTENGPPELRKLQAANLHPNLYFNRDDVPLLRQRSTTSHSHILSDPDGCADDAIRRPALHATHKA